MEKIQVLWNKEKGFMTPWGTEMTPEELMGQGGKEYPAHPISDIDFWKNYATEELLKHDNAPREIKMALEEQLTDLIDDIKREYDKRSIASKEFIREKWLRITGKPMKG